MPLQLSLSQSGNLPGYVGVAPPPPVISQVAGSDETLMMRAGSGDAAAFGELVERYSGRLYRLAYRVLCDAQEAEDAVQDCFTRLWQTAPAWEARGPGLLTWLTRVTTNLCLDKLRRLRVVPSGDVPEVEDEAPGQHHQLAMQRLEHLTEQALTALPPRHRAALVLCYLEETPNLLAAEMLGLNLKAMESLLFRAKRSLREELERMGVAAEDLEIRG